MRSKLFQICGLAFLLLLTTIWPVSAVELPSIGGVDTISAAEETRLGQAWLRQYRRQVPTFSDPVVTGYTEELLNRLAKHSGLEQKELSLILVKNRNLNAFAVPGGIIGIHTGLFQYAETEGQFASVISHELAHLSQRHYARGVEQRKGQQITNMAALLASLVLIATSQNDAGLAALSTTQANMINQQLRFSRSFEEEADRIGLETLTSAGFAAESMAQMFDQMLRASRFSTQPPEFLLTHPVTAKRLADAKNRARNLNSQTSPTPANNYDLVRARVIFNTAASPQQAIKRFEDELRGISPSEAGSRYGLILALTANKQFDAARENLALLRETFNDNSLLIIAESEIEAAEGKLDRAITVIENARANKADDYALTIQHSRLLATQQKYRSASELLFTLSKKRPNDPNIFYHLAELSGLAGDILRLHQARAEYYVIFGDFKNATQQLNNLIKRFPDHVDAVTQAKKRLKEIDKLTQDEKL